LMPVHCDRIRRMLSHPPLKSFQADSAS